MQTSLSLLWIPWSSTSCGIKNDLGSQLTRIGIDAAYGKSLKLKSSGIKND